MFVANYRATFLKALLKKVAVVLLVAFFSVSAYGQKYYLAYEPKIPEHSHVMYYGPISDSEFLYGTSNSEGSSSYSQKIYLYKLSDHSSTQLIHIESPASRYADGTSIIKFIKSKNRTYIISSGNLIVTNGTPAGTKLLKKFGQIYCCGNGSDTSRISPLFIDNDNLYFTFNDSINIDDPLRQYPNSMSIWKTDGTESGTRKISRSINVIGNKPYNFKFLGNAFINSFIDSNNPFYFSNGGLWKSNQDTKPFIVLDDELTESFIESQTVSTARGNFMCGLNFDKTGKALWRFSNSGKFEIIANGCDAVINTFNNRVFYTVGDQIWETDGTNLGEKRLFNFRSFQFSNGISSCKINNSLYLSFTSHDSEKVQLIKIDKSGTYEDLSSAVNSQFSNLRLISCMNDEALLSSYITSQGHSSYFRFNLKSKKLGKILNHEPRQLRNTDKSHILAQDNQPLSLGYGVFSRPFLITETGPPFIPSTLLLLDED